MFERKKNVFQQTFFHEKTIKYRLRVILFVHTTCTLGGQKNSSYNKNNKNHSSYPLLGFTSERCQVIREPRRPRGGRGVRRKCGTLTKGLLKTYFISRRREDTGFPRVVENSRRRLSGTRKLCVRNNE